MSSGHPTPDRAFGDILTINTGSSSLKAAVYRSVREGTPDISARADRIGLAHARLTVRNKAGEIVLDERQDLPDHAAALRALLAWMEREGQAKALGAAGHRVVHGGRRYTQPEIVTRELVRHLEELIPIDPVHLPQAIEAMDVVQEAFPRVPQVACFDTAFHRTMPRVAEIYPLPPRFQRDGIIRYGFHGLSYEYIMSELGRLVPVAAAGRVVIAHLGNGASMAAVHQGASRDTTMGFTPTGGLMMGTRTGDLDPGVLVHLTEGKGMSAEDLNDLVNRRSGLLGVSETSGDMQDLLERAPTDKRAAEAVELFCYTAKKFLGALITVLGGLDTLVFTGGIGEHAAPVREAICCGLGFLGIDIDPARNERSAPIISTDHSRVAVRVIATDEDLMIARHVEHVLGDPGVSRVSV